MSYGRDVTTLQSSDPANGGWALQITGQDANDTGAHDDFKSVCVLPGAGTTPVGDTWREDQIYTVVERVVDGNTVTTIELFTPVDWGDDPNYCWFVDCASGNRTTLYQPGQAAVAEIPAIPAVPATYKYTWISDGADIWALPLTDGGIVALDASPAVNIGGGIVGLPYNNASEDGVMRFVSGDVVQITGTTNYDGSQTLTAGTTTTQLQFVDTYVAETFDGTETVAKHITPLQSSGGRMAQDSSGNLYYGHNWYAAGSTYVTKIETDGTLVYDALVPSPPWESSLNTVVGLKISSSEEYIYVLIGSTLFQFNLATGAENWRATVALVGSAYDIALDGYGNAYVPIAWDGLYYEIAKFAIADGTKTSFTQPWPTTTSGYAIAVDNDLGIVVAGGQSYWFDTNIFNLSLRNLGDSSGTTLALGGTYLDGGNYYTYIIESGNILIWGGYIYVLASTPTPTLYKLDTELNIITSVAGPDYAIGFYVDLWDNLVVLNQDWTTGQSDVVWFYDSDLNYLSKVDSLLTTMFKAWDSTVGGAWIQGDAVFNGNLGTPEVPGTPGVPAIAEAWFTHDANHLDGASVCVYADAAPRGSFTMDGNDISGFTEADYTVVIAGLNYWSKLETMPIIVAPEPNAIISDKQIMAIRFDFDNTYSLRYGMGADSTPQDWTFNGINSSVFKLERGTFPYGSRKKATVYIDIWDPVPLGIRAIIPEVTFWRPK